MIDRKTKAPMTQNQCYKAFIVWVKDNGRADWNYYDPRDEEVYSECKVLLRTDNQREAVSLFVEYNLNTRNNVN